MHWEYKRTFSKKTCRFFALFSVALFVLFLRRPDTVVNAQFWAEDGNLWYVEAYERGIATLFWTHTGYFQTVSRLAAIAAQFVPLAQAPLLLNLIALGIQTLPVLLLCSSRFQRLIPRLSVRLFLAFLYLLLPNSLEVHGNISNSQTYLALTACLLLLADEGKTLGWKVFDVLALVLSGLSGPFSIFLTPIAFLKWLRERTRWHGMLFAIVFSTAILQLLGLLIFSHGERFNDFLTPISFLSLRYFFLLLSRVIFLGILLGKNGSVWLLKHTAPPTEVGIYVTLLMLFAILLIYALKKSPREQKLFMLFGFTNFIAALISPAVPGSAHSTWKTMATAWGIRYWIIPSLTFLPMLLWSIQSKQPVIRYLASMLLLGMSIGIAVDFAHKPFIDYDFGTYAENFQGMSRGEKILIPINPPGWTMSLTKK